MTTQIAFAPLRSDSLAKDELRYFLRRCRMRLSAEAVGMPLRRNRRSAGLSREEIAELIGVSTTWYTQFELGKAETVSSRFVRNVCRALRLAVHERVFLFALCGHAIDLSDAEAADDEALALLTTRPELPAATFDPGLRVVHANASFQRLKDTSDSDRTRDFAIRLFQDPGQRVLHENWSSVTAVYCGLLRTHVAYRRPEALRVVAALANDPDFCRHWQRGDIVDPGAARFTEILRHPVAGVLRTIVRAVGVRGATRFITVHEPADEDSAERLRRLTSAPARG